MVRSCHLIILSRIPTELRRHFYAARRFVLTFAILIFIKFSFDFTTDPLLKSIQQWLMALVVLFMMLSLLAFGFTEIRRDMREHHETTPLLQHRLPSYQSLFFGDQVNIIIIVLITILMLINPNTATSLQ